MNEQSNLYKNNENSQVVSSLSFLEPNRFRAIYLLSLTLPSWKIINSKLQGSPITENELRFVLSKTRGGRGLRSYNKQIHNNQNLEQGGSNRCL
jgi:hypothetical protein